jgi:hypothetical protein
LRDYAGSGIAIVTLIESTVSVITRHSDKVPIAIEVAIALVKRREVDGAMRLLKPDAPGDRIIGPNPCVRGRITPRFRTEKLAILAGNIAAATARKMAKSRQR